MSLYVPSVAELEDYYNRGLSAYDKRWTPFNFTASTPTRCLAANPKRFFVSIAVNSAITVYIGFDSRVASFVGHAAGNGSQYNYYWSLQASLVIGEFWVWSNAANPHVELVECFLI